MADLKPGISARNIWYPRRHRYLLISNILEFNVVSCYWSDNCVKNTGNSTRKPPFTPRPWLFSCTASHSIHSQVAPWPASLDCKRLQDEDGINILCPWCLVLAGKIPEIIQDHPKLNKKYLLSVSDAKQDFLHHSMVLESLNCHTLLFSVSVHSPVVSSQRLQGDV